MPSPASGGATATDAPAGPTGPRGAPRRWRDVAIALPLLGTALLMPPLVGLALPAPPIAGVPSIVLYVFGVWALLVMATARVTAGLCRDDDPAAENTAPDNNADAITGTGAKNDSCRETRA
ncbi:hypothetical protein [Roseospira visakhapatnamensis]|uniref:Uncharacterized protein n=1 Tax=Roseospira visakhapatnamensis TaxID=390880 RepID=A0A7W6W8K0_9PROT|nr:hypothetical protein [Roseospira visakhapatnamensis]MBB4264467.1 hypothetical protein [Roseospira visakhapatnamensis]